MENVIPKKHNFFLRYLSGIDFSFVRKKFRRPQSSALSLSAEDQLLFAETLIHPPTPNDALRRAKRLYMENVEPR